MFCYHRRFLDGKLQHLPFQLRLTKLLKKYRASSSNHNREHRIKHLINFHFRRIACSIFRIPICLINSIMQYFYIYRVIVLISIRVDCVTAFLSIRVYNRTYRNTNKYNNIFAMRINRRFANFSQAMFLSEN